MFDALAIAKSADYKTYQNRYPVIHIAFNELPRRCQSYEQYIARIEDKLTEDLAAAYPEAEIRTDDAVWDILKNIWNF